MHATDHYLWKLLQLQYSEQDWTILCNKIELRAWLIWLVGQKQFILSICIYFQWLSKKIPQGFFIFLCDLIT